MDEENKLARWLDNRMSDDELKAFQLSPEFETYSKIKEFSAQLKTADMDMDATYAAIVAKRNAAKPVTKTIRLQPWLGRIAAVLVLALGITFFLYTTTPTSLVADAGDRTEFMLPDNSEVVLNAGSEASYKEWNWKNNRQIELDGEAYFKVAKGQTFDVNTSMGKVTVVGTQFNVKTHDNRFEVTCFEGKVKVTYNAEEIMLTPGMSVVYEEGKTVGTPQVTATQPAWITHETTFYKDRLEDVIAEIERQFNVTIDVKGNMDSSKEFVGTVPMRDLDETIDIITTSYQLKAVKTGNKIVLLSE
jgi:ferric-dicitrate binding protein FerR (iron transport regulator)